MRVPVPVRHPCVQHVQNVQQERKKKEENKSVSGPERKEADMHSPEYPVFGEKSTKVSGRNKQMERQRKRERDELPEFRRRH